MVRKAVILIAATGGAIAIALAAAQAQGPGRMGPGGAGPGPGMMSPGMMEHGMMGQGMGPGMGMQRGMGYGPMMGGCGMLGADNGKPYIDGRLAFLKAELGITDAQKAAWDGYAAALRKNLENMQSMRAAMIAAAGDGTPVERLDRRLTAMEARVTTLKEVKPALATLYGALSEEQKKKASDLLSGMGCMM
ncbi:MAG: Spy/CpxP family protein refolding chaperone [Hyphomicrobiaceae bacterium]